MVMDGESETPAPDGLRIPPGLNLQEFEILVAETLEKLNLDFTTGNLSTARALTPTREANMVGDLILTTGYENFTDQILAGSQIVERSHMDGTKYFAIAAAFVLCTGFVVYRRAENHTQKIHCLASYDDLTGLLNRHEFEAILENLIADAKASERRHALMFIELDKFKTVNDTCGHLAGDELLKQITKVSRTRTRKTDTQARLGGDEFGIILPDYGMDKAVSIAEEIRQDTEHFRFIYDNQIFAITTSIGIAAITGDSTSLSELLENADSVCYSSKKQGKNSVQIYA